MSPTVPVVSEGKTSPGRMVMSPTTPKLNDGNEPPDNWEVAAAAADKKAAAILSQAKKKAYPSTRKSKPGPMGFEYVHTVEPRRTGHQHNDLGS
eukprot:2010060-Amphidinium_carterae.1